MWYAPAGRGGNWQRPLKSVRQWKVGWVGDGMEMRASRMATPVSSTTTMMGGDVDWAAAAQIRTRVTRGARMRSFVDILRSDAGTWMRVLWGCGGPVTAEQNHLSRRGRAENPQSPP